MQILILEDNAEKFEQVKSHLTSSRPDVQLVHVSSVIEYVKEIGRLRYDLLIVDLMVPSHGREREPVDATEIIIEQTRGDYKCPNFKTPCIVLTEFDEKAEENFRALNLYDFSVVTYATSDSAWRQALDTKIKNIELEAEFDFLIVCALDKEAEAYAEAGYPVCEWKVIGNLRCRQISLHGRSGLIVVAPRMGLVSCAITTTMAIQSFKPKLVCMSGICGGVPGASKIYDVVVAEACHQHDAGKWTKNAFKPEIYTNEMDHLLAQKIRSCIAEGGFVGRVKGGISPRKNEFPDGQNELDVRVLMAPASSGSAVIADEEVVAEIVSHQRKGAIFEMESYALYEAARMAGHRVSYFSAKSVVDDGGVGKGDHFHRVGCLLSAKVTVELIACFDFSA